jgi:hypothetical protein
MTSRPMRDQAADLPVVLSTVNVKTGRNAPTIHQLQDVLSGEESYEQPSMPGRTLGIRAGRPERRAARNSS